MTRRPIIAITMGDPAGIGPEIVLKALARGSEIANCDPVIYGDLAWMQRTAAQLGLESRLRLVTAGGPGAVEAGPAGQTTDAEWRQAAAGIGPETAGGFPLTAGGENPPAPPVAAASTVAIPVRQATAADLSGLRLGEVSAAAGRAAAECVIAAARAALAGEVDAIVTAPLNKEAIALGGYPYPGHTELLAEVAGTLRYGMLLLSGPLRVVHVSTHVSLREAIERVRADRIADCIALGDRACRDLGIAGPRIAVAGLNPHAGENGLFGTEEAAEIAPAIARSRAAGINASGPYPPDTVFARAANGEFDLVVAMYHDQGHIPVKLHGFDTGVNVTIGLPLIRVSVDHGTAFDIAGKGVAREQSLLEAIRVAAQLVGSRA
ncbi:MAG TPA: 4-hydroxythreonine-4-phosphate dehydrogenase PdxA [Chthonomonadaceae bacterium]|nr:4-hydroxythreonine-4-phosphate dehydrogenase PdxA [Chthonomonadaceae bacterium]